jgi:glycosyltransferase involved in cell wall biosynthesis
MEETDVTIVWSFRNRLDIFKKSILTADKNFPKGIKFCLIDAASSESTIRELRQFVNSIPDRQIRICESAYRSTLSEAWNLGMMLSDTKFIIFASSDVEFHSSDIFRLFKKAEERNKSKYILLENHAVFMLNKKIIKSVGWFDEAFAIGPCFDCDYMIRASEAGERIVIIDNNNLYTHYDTEEVTKNRLTSDVQDRLPMHDRTNDYIFKDKWQTSWEGWKDYPRVISHPPTRIEQVLRKRKEIDPHPMYTSKL